MYPRFFLFIGVFLCWLGGTTLAQDVPTVGGEIAEMFTFAAPNLEAPRRKPAVKIDPSVPTGEAKGGRELVVSAYAYCLRGRTASGRYTKHGIVAVDPRVIPLGSRLYVPGYGWAIAADTGGAIIGNKIDLWMPTSGDCYRWGVRRVKIKVYPRR